LPPDPSAATSAHATLASACQHSTVRIGLETSVANTSARLPVRLLEGRPRVAGGGGGVFTSRIAGPCAWSIRGEQTFGFYRKNGALGN